MPAKKKVEVVRYQGTGRRKAAVARVTMVPGTGVITVNGEVVTEIAAGRTEALVLYAVYETITYKIEYETNGGAFSKDEIAFIYDSYAALVADFLADYAAKYGVANLTIDNFYSKSADYGFRAFWNDAQLSAKWSWLK